MTARPRRIDSLRRSAVAARRVLNRGWAAGYIWYRTKLPRPQSGPPGAPQRPWTPLGNTRVRLGLGPANYAGQAAAFAQALCDRRADTSVEVVTYRLRESFAFASDIAVTSSSLNSPSLQREQVRRIVGRYTHMLVDAFKPVFGHLYGRDIGADLPALARAGVQVALLAHGSEVRDPRGHLERNPESHFRDAPADVLTSLIAQAERNGRLAARTGLPIFVTTPDLLTDLPWATWAPLVVDPGAWSNDRAAMQRARPVVLHAPSRRWTKGTQRILPTLTDLHDQGSIELRLAENIDPAAMPHWVREADVVLDQFGTGSYGAIACEAMAAGKPVVAYVSDATIAGIGEVPPIINATAATLRAALESLLDDRAAAAEIGQRGMTFVGKYHDGARTALALASFLDREVGRQ